MEPKTFTKGDRVRFTLIHAMELKSRKKKIPKAGTVISQGDFGMTYVLWDGKEYSEPETVCACHLTLIEDENTSPYKNMKNLMDDDPIFEVFATMTKNKKKTIMIGTMEECENYCKKNSYKITIRKREYNLDVRRTNPKKT